MAFLHEWIAITHTNRNIYITHPELNSGGPLNDCSNHKQTPNHNQTSSQSICKFERNKKTIRSQIVTNGQNANGYDQISGDI